MLCFRRVHQRCSSFSSYHIPAAVRCSSRTTGFFCLEVSCDMNDGRPYDSYRGLKVSFCSVFVAKLNEGNTKVIHHSGVIARVCHRCHSLCCFASKYVFGNCEEVRFFSTEMLLRLVWFVHRLCKSLQTLCAQKVPLMAGRRKSIAYCTVLVHVQRVSESAMP
jgi:hypothetical protein